ncbi:hypothetical protein IC582_000516 [Cucumis melo]
MGDSNKLLNDLIKALNSEFALKDLGTLSYFLGVEVSYPTNGGMFLSQAKYITDLLQKTKMIDAKPISTPMLANRILRYLKDALSHGLWLRCFTNLSIVGFVDADRTSDPDDRKSTSGYCVYFGNNLVFWGSKKQFIIS